MANTPDRSPSEEDSAGQAEPASFGGVVSDRAVGVGTGDQQAGKRRRLALHWRILIGMGLGLVVGLLVNVLWTGGVWSSLGVEDSAAFIAGRDVEANANATIAADAALFLRRLNGFVGDLFLRGLLFIAVPIVLFSLIVGVASLNDVSKLGRIGGKTIGIYIATTALAISIGLLLANVVGPGRGFPPEQRDLLAQAQAENAGGRIAAAQQQRERSTWDVLLEVVPSNPFESMARGQTLQVVVAALLIGVALTLIPREKSRPVVAFCDGMTEAVIKVVHLVLWMAPYATFALIARVSADLGVNVLGLLVQYCITVIGGLAIMMFAVYPSILRVFTPVGYRRFFRAISPAQLLAFSSSSSGATLPVTLECVEQRLGVREQVGSFVVPLGATINMDGTALYQGVAAVFIAQMFGIPLTLGDQLTIVLTATLASIGTAAVPGVGMVMLVIVLSSLKFGDDVMAAGIAVIFGVDRILDMCRTATNVTGDCMVAAVVASGEGALLTESEVAEMFAESEAPPLERDGGGDGASNSASNSKPGD